ncbi:MAG: hypothetical protein HRU75_13850 [Planctomycetia bacterium]|nr:MAG: hypothetical protein HRU75_13850 [Planctomycetia bacterium]
MSELLTQLPSLGVAGLLFVMWWHERLERQRAMEERRDAQGRSVQLAELNERLLDVVQSNTQALVGLREELRSLRCAQGEWLSRLVCRPGAVDAA